MRIICPVLILIASIATTTLIFGPRILIYYHIDLGTLNALVSPWATFVIFLFVGGLVLFPRLKNLKTCVPFLLLLVVAAMGLTFYFCKLPLPWQ